MKTNKRSRTMVQRIKAGVVILSMVFGAGLVQNLALAETGASAAKTKATAAREAAPADVKVQELNLSVGKSYIESVATPFARVSVGNPEVAEIRPITPKQLYILGIKAGSTNVMLWDKQDRIVGILNVNVSREFGALNAEIKKLGGAEKATARSMGESIILEGSVPDATVASKVSNLAEAFVGKDQQVVNMLRVEGVQQVLLEVKIAEVNRTLLEKMGVDYGMVHPASGGGTSWNILDGFLAGAIGILPPFPPLGATSVTVQIDARKHDGLIKILAEPNIVAISGQEGSFLAGGEIMIPVSDGKGGTTLQSKQFGVGLSFTPTVLEDGRIHMRVVPEVTDLVGFTVVAGTTTLVTTLTTRRVATTVELREGQSLAIGGLLTDTVKENIKRLPILGEIPILGALFRSSEYQTDKTELLIVVTPRLLKPLAPDYQLPTDAFKEPSRSEFFFEGRMEGRQEAPQPASVPPDAAPDAARPLVDGAGNSIQFGHQLK